MDFPIFSKLPPELRQLIWASAIPDDIPEVCTVWPQITNAPPPNQHDPPPTLTVDTAFPTIMHVSREARSVALARIQLRECPEAACALVPVRAFRPEVDTLSHPEFGYARMRNGQDRARALAVVSQYRHKLRRLAIEFPVLAVPGFVASLRQQYPLLEAVSVVFRGTSRRSSTIRFDPPTCRKRLQHIPDEIARTMEVECLDPNTLNWHGHVQRTRIQTLDVSMAEASCAVQNLVRLEAKIFVEYRRGRWREMWNGPDREEYQVPAHAP